MAKITTCRLCRGPIRRDSQSGICTRNRSCRYQNERHWWHSHLVPGRLLSARKRAAKAGIPFTLTPSDIPVIPADCPCCHTAFDYNDKTRNRLPTLDRVVPGSGYVPGNVQWLCGRCNRIKTDASPEELMRIALFMRGQVAL